MPKAAAAAQKAGALVLDRLAVAAAGVFTSGRRLEDIANLETAAGPLGQGSFGTVWRGKLKSTNEVVAIKALDKRLMREKAFPEQFVHLEVELMREFRWHAGCVQLRDFVEESATFFLILEFCGGGDLEDATKDKNIMLGERQTRRIMQQMLEAISYMHERAVCHRDIKPQNTMIVGTPSSPDVLVKIGDFGVASRMTPGVLLQARVGTPAFMAPEIHLLPDRSAGYDTKVDTWAAGAVMVFLLAHEYPFVDAYGELIYHQLLKGELPLWDASFASLFDVVKEAAGMPRKLPSQVAQDLVRRLLNPKRQQRLTACAALRHAWFSEGDTALGVADLRTAPEQPLLSWSDFDEGLGSIEREFQQMAAAAARVAQDFGNLQVRAYSRPTPLRLDEQHRSCVVCSQSVGNLGYLCPNCSHAVCSSCLAAMPKAQCPHCHCKVSDAAVTQAVARLARGASALGNAAWGQGSRRSRAIDFGPQTVPFANIEFGPAEDDCREAPSIPASAQPWGTIERDPARDALSSRGYPEVAHEASGRDAAEHRRAAVPIVQQVPIVQRVPRWQCSQQDHRTRAAKFLQEATKNQGYLHGSHSCYICRRASSSLDVGCPSCGITLCLDCAGKHLVHDTCCPHCKEVNFTSIQSVEMMRNAAQVRDSAQKLWTGFWSGQEYLHSPSSGSEATSCQIGAMKAMSTPPSAASTRLTSTNPASPASLCSRSSDEGRSRLQQFMSPALVR